MKPIIFVSAVILTSPAIAADYGYQNPQSYVPEQGQNVNQTVVVAPPVYTGPRCHTMMVRDDILTWVWTRRDVCELN